MICMRFRILTRSYENLFVSALFFVLFLYMCLFKQFFVLYFYVLKTLCLTQNSRLFLSCLKLEDILHEQFLWLFLEKTANKSSNYQSFCQFSTFSAVSTLKLHGISYQNTTFPRLSHLNLFQQFYVVWNILENCIFSKIYQKYII